MKRFYETRVEKTLRNKLSCIAIFLSAIAMAGCAITGDRYEEWTAQGYLTPGPSGEPEIIGVYETEAECAAAADAWMSRQVVGNPVYADCLPVDRN